MSTVPLIITPEVLHALADLKAMAASDLVVEGTREHDERMHRLAVLIPGPARIKVACWFEQRDGMICRRMSLSVARRDCDPSPEGVWMVARYLGFVGGSSKCETWLEKLTGDEYAINIVQPVDRE